MMTSLQEFKTKPYQQVACPILYLWQNFKNEAELSHKEILKMLQQSVVFLGSVNANINFFSQRVSL